jgi:hypothetical protein
MATSGTTSFNMPGGNLLVYALSLIGVFRTAITPQHMMDARDSINLLLASWGNDGPNLWTIDEVTQTLVAGAATYNVDPDTVMILDAFIRTNAGTEQQADRIIWPISRTEYASMPDKLTEAPPTTYWFDRKLAPTITLWQVPDDTQPYELHYYRYKVIEDQAATGSQNVDVPRWWLLATAFGVAELLAYIHAPDRADKIALKAAALLREAREQDTENVPLYVLPMMSGYFPR